MLQDWAGSAGARRVEISSNRLLSTLRWKTKFPRASFYPVSIGFESREKIEVVSLYQRSVLQGFCVLGTM